MFFTSFFRENHTKDITMPAQDAPYQTHVSDAAVSEIIHACGFYSNEEVLSTHAVLASLTLSITFLCFSPTKINTR
jgi:hypothetical protein